ncbi:serine protease inhibitor Kazal-type 1-like [Stigmatopora nigra]
MTGRILLLGLLLVCVVAEIKASGYAYPCTPEESTPNCPKNYDPLCGTDGITYPNRCVLCSMNPPVEIAFTGRCDE